MQPILGPPHLRLGAWGEQQAAKHLQSMGYKILARNWRFKRLELDLVCRQGQDVVFVEVKTRSPNPMACVEGVLSPHKQRCLVRAAQAWLEQEQAWQKSYRFDLVWICPLLQGEQYTVEHYQNVIQSHSTLAGGNTLGQYW